MYSGAFLVVAVSLLAGFGNAAAIEERATATCSTNALAKLMASFSTYASPYCNAVKVYPTTPLVTVTATPTVTISATLTSYKTITAPGTTTVVVNAKRDVEERDSQLEDRALLDFGLIAQLAGLNLAVSSVSTACSCFLASHPAPTATITVFGPSTKTVAVAKATAILTTTVWQNTVTSKNPTATAKTSSAAPTTSLSFVTPSSTTSSLTSSASQSVVTSVNIVSSSFVPASTSLNSAELSSLESAVSSALMSTATPTASSTSSGSDSPDTKVVSSTSLTSSAPASTSTDGATICGIGLQPYNSSNYTLPSTYNGCNPSSQTGFNACHLTIGGSPICSSCGKCSTTVCTKDSDCATGSACIINSACSAAGTAVCLQTLDTCYTS